MKSHSFIFSALFLLAFLITIASGFPFLPLFLIWQGLFGTLFDMLAWSLLIAGVHGFIFWQEFFWSFSMMLASALLLYLIRTYVFVKITGPIVTFLIFFFIIFWYIVQSQELIPSLTPVLKTQFFSLLLLLPFFYVSFKEKKPYQQRLWRRPSFFFS